MRHRIQGIPSTSWHPAPYGAAEASAPLDVAPRGAGSPPVAATGRTLVKSLFLFRATEFFGAKKKGDGDDGGGDAGGRRRSGRRSGRAGRRHCGTDTTACAPSVCASGTERYLAVAGERSRPSALFFSVGETEARRGTQGKGEEEEEKEEDGDEEARKEADEEGKGVRGS